MKRKVVYVDANGTKYYEAKKNEYNLQIIRAVAMDMGIVADRFLTTAEDILDRYGGNPPKEQLPFIEACMISAEILEKAMENAEDVYEYLVFAVSSVKDTGKTTAYYDDSELKQSIRDLKNIMTILFSFRKGRAINELKLPDWIRTLERAHKHSTFWQNFYDNRNKERGL